jgi:hypothetical protein
MPPQGLFAGHDWRTSPTPFPLSADLVREIESLGRVFLQFYRAVNLLYRRSVEGKQPAWVARWLDQGKPDWLIALQRRPAFKNEVPRVIRPDLLITEGGLKVTELDSIPGGIGLTAWLNQVYSKVDETVSSGDSGHSGLAQVLPSDAAAVPGEAALPIGRILGGADGVLRGFESMFGEAKNVHIVVSEEAATYRPEMEWMAEQINPSRFHVRDAAFSAFAEGDGIYRFFELFDLANVASSGTIFDLASERKVRLTPPPKAIFEEKMTFALLWNRNLQSFWRQELGESFLRRLQRMTPYTWLVDPSPVPPHATIPELNLTDWRQLEALSQKERDLILKVSGFSPQAWGARGVFLGSDLPQAEWAAAVEDAITHFGESPRVLQRYHKPSLVEAPWYDLDHDQLVRMKGRARLCPYYFVSGDADAARAQLGGVLATICPADKKIIHGMTEAVFAPCAEEPPSGPGEGSTV